MLERLDTRPIDVAGAGAVPAFVVVRDERLRMPAMLDHHRRLGVGPFFIVDNGSSDGTVEFLLDQPDVHLWTTTASFAASRCGTDWQLQLIDEHGGDGWHLLVDADELFVYAGYESRPIADLCRQLADAGADALLAVVIDMYGDGPIAETTYHLGDDPLDSCGWFDRTPWTSTRDAFFEHRNHASYFGGVKQRVFGAPPGVDADTYYTLNRVPLFRGGRELQPSANCHWMDRARFSPARGAILHWKYTAGFAAKVSEEVGRAEHWNSSSQYKQYAKKLGADPALSLYDAALSVRFAGSAQLEELGILVPVPTAAIQDSTPKPEDPHMRGMTQAARGDYEAAASSFRDAIATAPDAPWSYGALADVLTKFGALTEAAEAYRAALDRTPADALAVREAIAVGLGRAGAQETAIATFRAVLSSDPTRSASAVGLARALLAQADELRREAAQLLVDTEDLGGEDELLGAAIDAAPREPGLYRRLAQSLIRRGDRSRALVVIQLGLAHDPDDPDALALFAELLASDEDGGSELTAEQRDRVLGLVERAVLASPDDSELLVRRARLLARHGSPAQAVQAWRVVVEHEPEVALWHRELGDRLAASGDFAAAGESYDRAVRLGYDVY